jgi:hypothetical protein
MWEAWVQSTPHPKKVVTTSSLLTCIATSVMNFIYQQSVKIIPYLFTDFAKMCSKFGGCTSLCLVNPSDRVVPRVHGRIPRYEGEHDKTVYK